MALTAVSYYKNKKLAEFQPFKIYILSALRFAAMFLTALLLLNILLRTVTNRSEKPVLAIVADNSESVRLRPGYSPEGFLTDVFSLGERLSEKYNVKFYSFGENLSQVSGKEDFTFDEKYTDFSRTFESLKSVLYNTNSGAVVLASDGISNKGQNPVYAASESGQKIYTVILGDTASYKDLSITKVHYNETAFLGNDFPIEITVNAKMLKGQNAVCQVVHNGKTEFETVIAVKSDDFSAEVSTMLKAARKGLEKYTVVLKKLDGEITEVNNTREIIIDVIDDKYKILILSAMPHPDVAALRNAVVKNGSYETTVSLLSDFKGKVSAFDLVILVQVPSVSENADAILSEIKAKNIPALYILGHKTDCKKFSEVNPCLEIIKNGGGFDDALFSPNPKFSLLSFENGADEFLQTSPPLSCAFGEYKIRAGVQAFAFQTVRGVTTSKPLIAVADPQKAKAAVVSGEGLWRWRSDCYRRYLNHEKFDLFITRLTQFLLKRSEREMFSVSVKKIFSENEPVYFSAKLSGRDSEPVSGGEVTIEISDSDGMKKNYKFENSGTDYFLRIDNLKAGNYTFKAFAKAAGISQSRTGAFSIREIKTEAENLTANHGVMRQIAEKTSGRSFFPAQISELEEELLKAGNVKPVVYSEAATAPLITSRLLFFIIVLLFSTEWFLRKFWGTV